MVIVAAAIIIVMLLGIRYRDDRFALHQVCMQRACHPPVALNGYTT